MQDDQMDNTQQKNEGSKAAHLLADWWVYAFLAIFICGLVFLTYALTLRGDVINEFGKPGSKTAPPQITSQAAAPRRE